MTYLNDHGVEINAKNNQGLTPLSSAVKKCYHEAPLIAERLLILGADASKFLEHIG